MYIYVRSWDRLGEGPGISSKGRSILFSLVGMGSELRWCRIVEDDEGVFLLYSCVAMERIMERLT